jgi:hypothetical protein
MVKIWHIKYAFLIQFNFYGILACWTMENGPKVQGGSSIIRKMLTGHGGRVMLHSTYTSYKYPTKLT